MATLTTTGGAVITFNPSNINAIADHNDTTGEAVTCVYGVDNAMLMVAETVQDLMQRLGIEAAFAQLTRPNGSSIWISGSSVSLLRAPTPGMYASTVKTVISSGALTQGVRETPAQATTALNAHGGHL